MQVSNCGTATRRGPSSCRFRAPAESIPAESIPKTSNSSEFDPEGVPRRGHRPRALVLSRERNSDPVWKPE